MLHFPQHGTRVQRPTRKPPNFLHLTLGEQLSKHGGLCCHQFPTIFPVARFMSSLSDAIPSLQSTYRNRSESGRDAATKFNFFSILFDRFRQCPFQSSAWSLTEKRIRPFVRGAPRMCSRCCATLLTRSSRLRVGSHTLANLQ